MVFLFDTYTWINHWYNQIVSFLGDFSFNTNYDPTLICKLYSIWLKIKNNLLNPHFIMDNDFIEQIEICNKCHSFIFSFHSLDAHYFINSFWNIKLFYILSEFVRIYLGVIKKILNKIMYKLCWRLLCFSTNYELIKYFITHFYFILLLDSFIYNKISQLLVKCLFLNIKSNDWVKRVSDLMTHSCIYHGQ